VAESQVALGLLRSDEARLDEATNMTRIGLEQSRKALGPDDPAVARAVAAVGHVLIERGIYDSAVPLLQDAVRIYSISPGTTPELAKSMYDLANAHFYAGHLDVADSLTRRVMAMDRVQLGPRHPSVAED